MRTAKVIAGILILGQFCHPGEAFGQTASGAYNVNLVWNASTSAGVTGYRIYYGTTSGAYTASITLGNVTSVTVPGLASGATYYFAVTAIDADAMESGLSNQASFLPGLNNTRLRTAATGECVLTITGLIGCQYDIEATQDFKAWTIISTVTPGDGGSLEFSDPNAANYPKRFYRTRESQ